MSKMLEDAFRFFLDHKTELLAKYNGKVIVIKDNEVIGTYKSEIEAIRVSSQQHKLGTFLVQKCEENSEIPTFHSRVAFV